MKPISEKEKCRERLQNLEKTLKSFEKAHSFYLKNPDFMRFLESLVDT